jgi:inosine/xanthosine triphosphate pyrophosphatase family protein
MERCQVKRIVAGTTNPAKIAALRRLVAPVAEVIAPPVPGNPGVEEDGPSLADIASSKAIAWSRWLGAHDVHLPVIVTDGGLTIPALGDRWDPTRTRRFAGEGLTPLQRAQALLDRASTLNGVDRRIGWTEVAVIACPEGRTATYTAESPPGILATAVRPEELQRLDGFWVPAVWLCPEYGLKRLSDLTDEERARRKDHWHRLGDALRGDVETFLTD